MNCIHKNVNRRKKVKKMPSVKFQGLFLGATKFGFKTEAGQYLKGVSVRFIVDEDSNNDDNFIGSHVQKMTMPVEQWDSLISQGITTFSKIELTLAGFGRSSRLVKVEKVDDNG